MRHRSLRTFVALAAIGLLAGCASVLETLRTLPQPSARVVGARLAGLGFDHVDLVFDVEIRNPLSAAVPLADLDFDLATSGRSFLRGDVPLQGTVPAEGQRTVECPVRVDLVQTLRTLDGIRPGQVIDYRAALGLSIDIPGAGVQRLPLAHQGQLPVPAVPEVGLDAVRLDRLDLQQIAGTAVVRVGNPNAFAVAVERLDLGLSLGGRDVGDLRAAAPLDLSAQGDGTVEIPLRLSPLDLGTAIVDVLRSSSAGYGLTGGIALDTPFGALETPLEVTGQVPIQRNR